MNGIQYRYWTEQAGSYLLCRRAVDGGRTEYATSKKGWTENASDHDILKFVSEDAARNEAGNRGINPADVR